MVLMQQEKVTITLPTQIKDEVAKLKDEMKISMNSIYQTAIQEYIKKKNKERLRLEASLMVEEYKSNPEMIELANFEEDLVEY